MGVQLVAVGDAELEVCDWGSGDPILFLQTALVADELVPLANQPALAGFASSSTTGGATAAVVASSPPVRSPSDADDACLLLTSMGIPRAHIVGVCCSGAIGLQLAAAAPECAQSLVVSEPPPLHTSLGPQFRAANQRLARLRHDRGVDAALEDFMRLLVGNDWRRLVEDRLPDAVAQVERDAVTFFDGDIPALLDWEFSTTLLGELRPPAVPAGPSFAGGLVPADAQLLATRSSLRRGGPGSSTPLTCAVGAPRAGSPAIVNRTPRGRADHPGG